jgi:hypothetical protein
VFTDRCGKFQPGLLAVDEGISPGYGDRYAATLEGQSIDVTRAPAGYYYLIHYVNQDHSLREANFANNVSSVQIELRWPKGTSEAPTFRIVGSCIDRDRCPVDIGLRGVVPGSVSAAAGKLPIRVMLGRDATVTIVMRGSNGTVLRRREKFKAGTTPISIVLPPRARQPGRYSVSFTGASPGGVTVTRRTTLLVRS